MARWGKAKALQAELEQSQLQCLELALKNQELAKKAVQYSLQLKNQKQVRESEPSDYLSHLKAENQRLQFQLEQLQLESPLQQSVFLTELQLRNLELLDQNESLKYQVEFEQSQTQWVEAKIPALKLRNQQLELKIQALEEQVEQGEYPENNQGRCCSDCC